MTLDQFNHLTMLFYGSLNQNRQFFLNKNVGFWVLKASLQNKTSIRGMNYLAISLQNM